MKKVKIFRTRASAHDRLENMINEWMKEEGIEVLELKLAASGEEHGDFIIAVVIYEE